MKKLTLADGRSIDLSSKKEVKQDEPLTRTELEVPSVTPKPRQGVKLEDLPTASKQMNVICAVVGYRLLGISDPDICYALGCTDEQLFNVVQSEGFSRSWQLVIEAFVAGQTNTAKDIIAGASLTAAATLVDVMKSSRNEANKMRAAESVLNRMGISEANADNGMSQGLIIKVVKDTQSQGITINVGA